jgi:hypothetical protein
LSCFGPLFWPRANTLRFVITAPPTSAHKSHV